MKIRAIAIFLPVLAAACGDGSGGTDTAPDARSTATTIAVADPAPPAFATCRSCHSTEAGRNGIGPSLHGIVGTRAGSSRGFAFSPALKASGIVWERRTLDQWLQGPMKMVPGTRMVMPVPDPARRKAIVDYLETLK